MNNSVYMLTGEKESLYQISFQFRKNYTGDMFITFVKNNPSKHITHLSSSISDVKVLKEIGVI